MIHSADHPCIDQASMFPAGAVQALNMLRQAGYEAYFVGGCVRDLCRGTAPKDYDIATSASPTQICSVFREMRTIETGIRFGTVVVCIGDMTVEVTAYRTESRYADGRHPDCVHFTPCLEEDAARRDFTMNAMYFAPPDQLRDPFGGREDIAQRIIRCVGDGAQRFEEDALRILRALRFSAALGFSIEEKTAAAMRQKKALLRRIAPERIYQEFIRLICGRDAARVLCDDADILAVFLPFLEKMRGFAQHSPYHAHDLLTHTAIAVASCPPIPHLRLAALFHDAGKIDTFSLDPNGVGHFYGHAKRSAQIADAVLAELRTDHFTRERVGVLIRYHDTPLEDDTKKLKRWLGRLGEETLRELILLARADNLAQDASVHDRQKTFDAVERTLNALLTEDACVTRKKLAITGSDLIAAGAEEGPMIGTILNCLLEAVIDGRISNERDALLALAAERISAYRSGDEESGTVTDASAKSRA